MVEAATKLPTAPEKIPIHFELAGTLIDGAVVKQLTYSALADHVDEARTLRQPALWEARLMRVRMVRQVIYYAGPATVAISTDDILRMPIPSVHKIQSKLEKTDSTGQAGKIIKSGDGIDTAIVYELGTPISMQGKDGLVQIRELEFLARTYGDIEDVLSEPSPLRQTMLLISTVGKPLGTSLTALPGFTLSQITVADGATINTEVLPHFLGSADES